MAKKQTDKKPFWKNPIIIALVINFVMITGVLTSIWDKLGAIYRSDKTEQSVKSLTDNDSIRNNKINNVSRDAHLAKKMSKKAYKLVKKLHPEANIIDSEDE